MSVKVEPREDEITDLNIPPIGRGAKPSYIRVRHPSSISQRKAVDDSVSPEVNSFGRRESEALHGRLPPGDTPGRRLRAPDVEGAQSLRDDWQPEFDDSDEDEERIERQISDQNMPSTGRKAMSPVPDVESGLNTRPLRLAAPIFGDSDSDSDRIEVQISDRYVRQVSTAARAMPGSKRVRRPVSLVETGRRVSHELTPSKVTPTFSARDQADSEYGFNSLTSPTLFSSDSPQKSTTRRSYLRDTRPWKLETYSYVIPVTIKRISSKQAKRGSLTTNNVGDILHDLLAASFVPLTDHRTDPEEIQDQAAEFLSSFSDNNATWKVDVGTLPFRQGQLLKGLTENARDEAVGRRFLRFRFPLVRFEWQVETPYSVLKLSGKEPAEIKVMWKAWTRSYSSSGLVAYGSCTDSLMVTERGCLVIKKRLFQVINIIKPELMTPVPYPNKIPPLSSQNDFMIFSTSQTMIQILQSSKGRMAFLVALSALATSLKPIVDRYSHAGGWVLTGIGIVAASTSIISVFVGWMLKWIEANAAKHRQLYDV